MWWSSTGRGRASRGYRQPGGLLEGSRLWGQAGQVLAITAVTIVAVIAAVGLAVDAGLIFAARRALQGAADAAVTAAAQQINVDLYRQSDGQVVELDPGLAYTAAVERLQASPHVRGYSVMVSTARVDVSVQGRARLAFLPAVLPVLREVPVGTSAWAIPRYGIAAPGQ